MRAVKRKREKERKKQRRLVEQYGNMSMEDRMETHTFKRFSSTVDSIMESAEDVDMAVLNEGRSRELEFTIRR